MSCPYGNEPESPKCRKCANCHFLDDLGTDTPILVDQFKCEFCKGEVDRYVNRYECQKCGATGDIKTKRMTPPVVDGI